MAAAHPDPFRAIDAQADPARFIATLEERGRTLAQVRLRRRFLRFVPVRAGTRVLEVGCGSGVVLRDLAPLAGPKGHVVGVDTSQAMLDAARQLCRPVKRCPRLELHHGDGAHLPFPPGQFDVTLGITVILHVPEPAAVVEEMVRVTRPGGRVGLQDQDFGMMAVTHPDPELTDQILDGVPRALYEEPYSGRRLPGLLREAGLRQVRLLTD